MEMKQPLDNITVSSGRISPDKPFIEFKKTEIDQSIVARFEQMVAKYPSHIAIRSNVAPLTYASLNQKGNQVARAIIERRERVAEPVALFLDQGALLISAMLAVLKTGKAYVALDTSFPQAKCEAIVRHTKPGLVLTDKKNFSPALELAGDTSRLLVIDEPDPSLSSENLNLNISPEATAYIMYTSGSTGEPKGVSQSHQSVLHNVMRCTNMLHIAPDDRLSLLWSCSFAASVPNVFGALLNGASLHPYNLKRDGTDNLADWLTKAEITIYHSVPTVYRHFLSSLTGEESFPKLRLIKLSGESVSKKDLDLYKRHFHKDCIFHVSFASTETNIIRQFFCDHNTTVSGEIVPAGYEVEDMKVLILDEEGREVEGSSGEIAVRSRYLPTAYYGNDDRDESPFLRDEKAGHFTIYKTGDIGHLLPDGCLVHLGRKDMQVKVRGYRVEISEVENAMSELPVVKGAVIAGRDDPYGSKLLVGYVVFHKGQSLTPGELRNLLKEKLPDYMVPSRFVFLDALPLTLSGKLDRRALPDPDYGISELEENYVAPRTTSEMMLAKVWRKILKIKRVGVFDNFFDLGGHSLLVATLATEIRKKTGKTLPVTAILQSPTISQLAKVLWADESPSKSASVLVQTGGAKSPFFWVGINTYRPPYLGLGRPVHGIILQGDYGKPIVYRTVEELAAHHLEEIRAVQPKGPYLLGGYCFSGLVALEMAQHLIRQGEEVSLLCLIEPLSNCRPSGNGALSPNASLKSKTGYLGSKLPLLLSARKIPYVVSIINKTITEKINFFFCRSFITLGRSVPRRYRDFYRLQTAGRYTVCSYPGRAAIFLREHRCGEEWNSFGEKGTFVSEVIGTVHHTMMDEPYVGTWIKELNRCLDQIQAEEKNAKKPSEPEGLSRPADGLDAARACS